MNSNKFCDRCGIRLDNLNHTKRFSFGFKEIELELCTNCSSIIEKRHREIQKKYSGKLLKLYNKFYRKLLK